MSTNAISNFLLSRIDAGDFPSAVYLVGENGKVVLSDALGQAVVEPERIDAGIDTIYDLASVTKVLVTGLLAAKLVEKGGLKIEQHVSSVLDEFDTAEKSEITISDLLSHTSGLVNWLPLYLLTDEPAGVLPVIAGHPVNYERGTRVVYSDLNFIALQLLMERITGRPIEDVFKEWVADPLRLGVTRYSPPEQIRPRIAASERGNCFERQTCIDLGYAEAATSARIRDHQIWGEVHDGNAWFMRGVAGHAGLFSTAFEVFTIAQQFLPQRSQLLEPQTCMRFSQNLTRRLNEHRSFAFQLASSPESAAGTRMSPGSFGHLGFTGTSLWIDPLKQRIFILLTNRTHDHDLPFVNINSVRRRFHDLAIDSLDGNI